jgi:two-component system cell cycle sensor histidine kinase/response regulator CckA
VKDERKTKAQLAEELADLRRQLAERDPRKAGPHRPDLLDGLLLAGPTCYADLFEGVPDGVSVVDPQGRFVYANRTVVQRAGVPRERLIGTPLVNMIPPSDRDRVMDHFHRALRGETIHPFQHAYRTTDDRTVQLQVTATPIRAGGDVVGLLAITRDVTQHRLEEAERERAARELALILDGVTEHVIFHDPSMCIVWASRAAADSVGKTVHALRGRHCYEVWHGRDAPCEGCPVQAALETGQPHRAEIATPDGRVWDVRGRPVYDDDGTLVGAVEVTLEITGHRRAEEALRESERSLQAVFDGIQDGLAVRDRDYNILRVNRWVERLFADQMPLVGKKCYAAFEGRDAPCPECPSVDRGRTGEIYSRVALYTPAEGPQRRLEVTTFPLTDAAGEVVGAIEHAKDITNRWRAEEDLRLAQASINAASDSIFWIAPDGRFMYANDAACRTLGYTRDELLGKRVADIDPDYAHEKRAAQWERVKRGGVVTFESRHRTREGRVFPVEVTANYLRFGDHEYEFGFAHDITDRKRAEDALRRSEANYRAIFNAVNDVLFVHDIETGDVVDSNQKMAEVYGYDLEEIDLLNEQFRRGADPPYSYEDQIRWLRRAADQGPQLFEWLATDRNGRRFWVEISLRRAAIGGRDRLLAVLRDIEDRKRAEEALRRSEENYRVLFEESLDGIVVVADGCVAGANRAFADIHRMDLKDVLGMPITEFMHPDEHEAACANIRSVLEGRADSHTERGRRAIRADGTFALIEVLVKRIDWEGRPAVLAIVRDITERGRLEEELRQAQKMEAVGQLAGGIAHDFSNLMTGILCHAALLKVEDPSPDDVREAADLIEGAAQRATELTSQLLGFARRGKRQDAAVDLNATVETSVRLLSRSLDSRVHVGTRFCDEQAFVRGDPVQMEQVVLNLAMNARDAMPDGGNLSFITQTVDVRAEDCDRRPGAQPGRYVVLSVEDTGCGIPVATRGRVFEPFYTTKPQGKGTGMGLAMVYGIVKDHDGWVEVTSEAGRGTAFRVFLPEAEPPADLNLNAPPDAGPILADDDEELEGR